jgi:hypothetical protein
VQKSSAKRLRKGKLPRPLMPPKLASYSLRYYEAALGKKLTVTVEDEVYEGLHKIIGRRRIGRFLSNLARAHERRLVGLKQPFQSTKRPWCFCQSRLQS